MNQLSFKPVQHLKMTIWILVLWEILMQFVKKWLKMFVKRTFRPIANFDQQALGFPSLTIHSNYYLILCWKIRTLKSAIHCSQSLESRNQIWFRLSTREISLKSGEHVATASCWGRCTIKRKRNKRNLEKKEEIIYARPGTANNVGRW